MFFGTGYASSDLKGRRARRAADQHARAAALRILDAYAVSMLEDCKAVAQGADRARLRAAIQTFARHTKHTVQIIDHWKDPESGTVHARARLDLRYFYGLIDHHGALSQSAKAQVKEAASRSFTALAMRRAQP